MPIDIDVRSFTELNSNYTDINGKVNSLQDMALNPVPEGSNNKISVRRSTGWNIEGEEAYNGQFQELGNISGDVVLELNTTTSRIAIIATITDHTFVTSFGADMLTSHVYTIFLKQNSTGNHSVRWPYGVSVLNMVGPDPNQITAVYVVKLPSGKIFVKCEAFQNTVEIGGVIKEFQPPTITYPYEGNAPIGFTWSKIPELAYGGTLSDLYSDWEIARDELYTVLLFSSYNNIVDLYSIDVVLSASGTAYMRTRYGGNIDGEAVVGPWEEAVVEISGVPPLWAPAEIPGVIVFDALDSDNITLSGSSVTSWADMMGSGITASQDTPTLQPTMGTGEVVFAEDYLTIASSNGAEWCRALHSTGGHILALVQPFESANPNAATCLCGTNGAGATANVGMTLTFDDRLSVPRNDSIVINATRGSTGANSVHSVHQDIITGGSYHLIDIIIDPDNETTLSRSLCSVNGADDLAINTDATSASTANAGYNFQIGAGGNNTFPLTGRIKCLAITPSVLTPTEREKFVGWAAHRHGLASNLPDDHPYKYAPPRKFTQDTWTPAEITTALWLDAADSTTIMQSSGITQWADKSGNNRHAVPPLATKPTYATSGINSLGSVVFSSGADPFLVPSFASPTGANGLLVAFVAEKTGEPVNYSNPLTFGAVNAQWSFILPKNGVTVPNGENKCWFRNRSTDTSHVLSVNNFGVNVPRLVVGTLKDSDGMALTFDGNVEATRAPATHILGSAAALTIGSSPDSSYSGNRFQGRMGEIIIVYGDTSIATHQKIEGYLAHKWGLAANLPPDHPYKTAEKYVTDNTTLISGNLLEGTTGLTISQVNSDPLNVGIDVAGSNGGLFRIYANGSWTFDPNSEFGALFYPETADTSVTYYASDGTGEAMATLTVTVTSAVVVDTDPYWYNVAFLSHFDGAVGSKPTVDEKGASMTAYTNVAISDVQSKFSNTLKFDGTCPSYLAIARHSGFDFGSGDFTIEMHLFLNNTPSSYYSLFSTSFSNSPWYGIRFRVESTRKLSAVVSYNGTAPSGSFETTLTVPVASWCHVAFVRKASTLYLFIDGQVAGTLGGITGALYYSTREPVQVGVDFSAHYTVCSRTYLNGYIDDLRVTKGIARYDDAFTVPQLPFPSIQTPPPVNDDRWADVVFCINAAGADGSTVITDAKGLAISRFGDTQIDTSLGYPAVQFDGTGDYLTVPNSAGTKIESGVFTFDAWIYFDGLGARRGIIGNRPVSVIAGCVIHAQADNTIRVFITGGGTVSSSSSYPLTSGLRHIEVSIDESRMCRIFIDGVLRGSGTLAAGSSSTVALQIGREQDGVSSEMAKDRRPAMRLTRGTTVRHTADFTPPSFPFPTS